jgi:hypothetical protein
VTCNVAALPPAFSAQPAPLGSVITLYASVGIPASTTILVTNAGAAGAGGLTLTTSGLASPFAISPPAVGAPGIARTATQPLTVTCAPSVAATFTQTLSIATNDPARGPALYTVRCTGLAPEFAATPDAGATLVLTAPRGGVATGSIRVTNPTQGAGTLDITPTGLSDVLSISPPSASIPPPNIPPSATYAPASGATVTLSGGNGSIVATSNGDGSGSFAPATTTINGCTISGAGAARFGAVALSPNPIALVGVTVGSGTIGLSCSAGASASATLTCTETRGPQPPIQRQWPLTCSAF